jgi:hypothetical protein
VEQPLAGGNAGGAVLVEGTVRRATGPWTPAVHALLRHLADDGTADVSLVLGIDEQGREVSSFLPGARVGDAWQWPCWVHSDVRSPIGGISASFEVTRSSALVFTGAQAGRSATGRQPIDPPRITTRGRGRTRWLSRRNG